MLRQDSHAIQSSAASLCCVIIDAMWQFPHRIQVPQCRLKQRRPLAEWRGCLLGYCKCIAAIAVWYPPAFSGLPTIAAVCGCSS